MDIPTNKDIEDTKSCNVCAERIMKAARICTHCNSYQDWRGKLNMGSTVLSLLVALVSVLSVAAPAIVRTLTPKNSDLKFSFQGATDRVVTLLITNDGIRPGTIHYPIKLLVAAGADYIIEKELSLRPLEPVAKENADLLGRDTKADPYGKESDNAGVAQIVEAGKSRLFNLYLPIEVRHSQMSVDLQAKTCAVTISQTDFRQNAFESRVPISCRALVFLRRGA